MQRRSIRPGFALLSTAGAIVLIVLLILMPDLPGPAASGDREDVTAVRGRIESIEAVPVDGSDVPAPKAQVRVLDGPLAGDLLEAFLIGPGGSQVVADYRVGDEVLVTITDSPDGGAPFVAVSDRWRLPALQVLAILFALAVVLVGGWHGIRALIALGLTIVVILKVLLPLVIGGVSPLPLAVIAASAITVVTIGLTEGWKRASLTAILGTTAALAITGLLSALVTAVMGFTYTAGSDLAFLVTASGEGLDLRGLLLAAFILGAVGVLDDVTVTQAAIVEELARTSGLRGRALFASSMTIGRSHIGATVNTLFLAYVGAGLPLLVLLLVSSMPGAMVVNSELFAAEIVRTLVGSIGIVAAVPLTAFVGVWMLGAEADAVAGAEPTRRRARASQATLMALVVGGLLAATALLPLGGGPRPALQPPAFEPGGSFDSPSASPSDGGTAVPILAARGQTVPIEIDGEVAATIAVTDWLTRPAAGTTDRISVTVHYEATTDYALASGFWELLFDDGTRVPMEPSDGQVTDGRVLAPGETLDLTLSADVPSEAIAPFLVYVDASTRRFVFAVALT